MSANLLAGETSPYLLQHKDNPVHWMPWGDAVFERARAENRPILLSVGYAACHWCHVMAHECFEDPEVAAVMNELFVNVKLDREERPDLDRIYMTALQAMGEHGGWPLTMFLTPDGEPFWGGTYFPKQPRYGRPGFIDILKRVSEVYHSEPDKVANHASTLTGVLNAPRRTDADGQALTLEKLDDIAGQVLSVVDFSYGGIRGAPKFPHAGLFELLWRAWLRGGREDHARAVRHTLACMCQGGIYDHLGGGFARYAVDERWLVPHFEKMLYDNAQALRLMTLVWQHDRDPLLERRIRETCGWVLNEMVDRGGGFAASLDADSEGEEGKFYLWTDGEVRELLGGEDADLFCRIYGVTPTGNFEGRTILNRLTRLALADEETEQTLARCRERLLERRSERVRPGFDDKVLSDWNGLMISSLAFAAFVFGEREWLQAAQRAFAFVRDEMWIDGRLRQSARAGRVQHHAIADGYANMIAAGLALHQVGGERAPLETALAWYDEAEAYYWDEERGGYLYAARNVPHLIVRTVTADDDATPAANATMLANCATLASLTGESRFGERAGRLLDTFTGQALSYPLAHVTLLNGFERLARPLEAVIVGDCESDAALALARALAGFSLPDLTLSFIDRGDGLPESHPAHGKDRAGARAALYLCRERACSLPLTAPEQITPELLGTRTEG